MRSDGTVRTGLNPADFRGTAKREEVSITSVAIDQSPRRVVLLLDMSGSMHGAKWAIARRFALTLIDSTSSAMPLAIVGFSEHPSLISEFDAVAQKARTALETIPEETPRRNGAVRGRTAMRDALAFATEKLRPNSSGDAIILITDAGDNASKKDQGEMQRMLVAARVRLFLVYIPETDPMLLSPATMEELQGPVEGRELALTSGGLAFNVLATSHPPADSSKLENWMPTWRKTSQQLVETIARSYAVDLVYLPSPKWRSWKLEIVDKQGKRDKDAVIFYPRLLPPCGPESESVTNQS